MSTIKKVSSTLPCETASSFFPLSEQSSNIKTNLPLPNTQIQNLISQLIQRKAQFREEKLKQECFNEKAQKQENRIGQLRIEMQHQMSKQSQEVQLKEKLLQAIDGISIEIKELNKKKSLFKNDAQEKMEQIFKEKKVNNQVSDLVQELQITIKEKKTENIQADQKIQNLQSLITNTENEVRCKQDGIKNLKLEENQLVSLDKFIKQKIILMRKQNHEEGLVQKEKVEQIIRLQQKVNNLKKQKCDIDWNCEQVSVQNEKVHELNSRLEDDLQNVKKHLESMKKTNQVLKDSLTDYGVISEKIAKLIIH